MTDTEATSMLSRRQFGTLAGGAPTAMLAGCVDGIGTGANGGSGGEDPTATAAFFAVYDLARHVVADTGTVVDLVPVGSHGDDWEPDPGIIQEITRGEAFVYIEGFRGWSDRQANTLREEYPEVTVIDLAEGIEFIEGEGGRARDPHFWLDPELAVEGVETLREGFTETNPDHAEAYESNAEAYAERLREVDERFETELADRARDHVVMGNHNSFTYWEPAYGIEVTSASGISPDEDVSARDRRDIEALMDQHGIEHVAYDMYESDRVSERIAADTGAELVPLSPVEATTEEQFEAGMGYVEHMLEINLESLRTALGAE